ncbi:MAG: hypothetical protein GWN58_33435 [Anaerolineae bacterium]|nr:hypothetical protein [Thermoplasmata archaeon]NIV34180.1 hypothetical protein [Anaerolineae bacterium]NIY06031.1 hypothetical protein [Thermoplasmata archaeon]
MIYPINIKPAPRVVAGEHKGAEITHVGLGPRSLEIYTAETVFRATPDQLPHVLQRTLGAAIKEAGRPGPFIITPEELAEDVTYDPDSSAPSLDKPEPQEVEHSHPKERKLKQELGLAPPETDEPLEIPKYEKFPPSLPTDHPKEKALERQQKGEVVARGEDKIGFDINEFNKAHTLLEKAWQPPDSKELGYQFNPVHHAIYPGEFIKNVAPKIKKATDISRAMQAVTTHWLKKNPPTLRQPSAEDYEDDDGTLNEIMDEVEKWWKKNGNKAVSYYKTFKIPPQVIKLVDQAVQGAVEFNKKRGIQEDKYLAQVAKHWATDCAKYTELKSLVGNLMGALIKTTNTMKPRGAAVEATKTETDKPMFKKGKLNLTPFHLRSVGGAMFAKKSDAVQFAKKKGWKTKDITPAFNRFNEFYVVGQQIDPTTFRVLGPQGHVDLKFGPRQGAFLVDAKMKYLGQCDRLRKQGPKNEANWQEMMKQKKPISMSTFKSKADYKAILDEDETLKDFIAGDPDAGFFQSVWGNKKCVFLRTAGFEFIWV